MITILKTDGSRIECPNQDLNLAWMQEKVGGNIEIVEAPDQELIVNEDAEELPINPSASYWFAKYGRSPGIIRGDAILVTLPDRVD